MENRNLHLSGISAARPGLRGARSFLRARANQGAVVEEIIARVNNNVITMSDYQKAETLHEEVAHDCQGCAQEKSTRFKEQQKDCSAV